MKLLIRRFLCLRGIFLVSTFLLIAEAARSDVIIDNLGIATPGTKFSRFGASGLSITENQYPGPQFILTDRTMITEIGGFVNNCSKVINGIPMCPSTLPFVIQIRPANSATGFPDPSTVLGEFTLSHDNDPLLISYESVAPNIILEPGTYFALFAPQQNDDSGGGSLLQAATNPVSYRAAASIPVGTLNPATGLPNNFPPHNDFTAIAVRILGTPARNPVPVDIKPASCPNRLNVASRGRLPLAVVGTEDFDPTTVDPASVRLVGVAPLRSSVSDIATAFQPFIGKQDALECTDLGSDGFLDLVLHFDTQEILQGLEKFLGTAVVDGETLVLQLIGNLVDGTLIDGEDLIIIQKERRTQPR